jgi:hypothetical protein
MTMPWLLWRDPALAWFDWLGGRKFVIAETALIFGFVLALLGKLTPEFTFVLIAVCGFYSGANVLNTTAALKAGAAPGAAAPTVVEATSTTTESTSTIMKSGQA